MVDNQTFTFIWKQQQEFRGFSTFQEALTFWLASCGIKTSTLEYVEVNQADKMVGFMIPNYGVAPTDRSIDWMHEATQEWEGDDSGVNIYLPDADEPEFGAPGDFVFQHEGLRRILKVGETFK